MKHTTEFEGYEVVETTCGLDVYDGEGNFLCELGGKTLANFTYTDENNEEFIDDVALEDAIDEELDIEDFLINRNR